MPRSPTMRRIMSEAREMAAAPSGDIHAAPLDDDLHEWHFTIRGPPNTDYAAGLYHGRIVLPPTYPLRPPMFRFTTPSGRFEPNREICLSISGHHEETWQPAWGVRTALVALRAFMETDVRGQVGGTEATAETRRRLAAESGAFVCSVCGGRSNAAILAAAAEDERAMLAETNAPKREDEVPAELQLVFRDELKGDGEEAGEETPADEGSGAPADVPTDVTTTESQLRARTMQAQQPAQQPAPAAPAVRPRNQALARAARPVAVAQVPPAAADVLWVDRIIVLVCISMGMLLVKMIWRE